MGQDRYFLITVFCFLIFVSIKHLGSNGKIKTNKYHKVSAQGEYLEQDCTKDLRWQKRLSTCKVPVLHREGAE